MTKQQLYQGLEEQGLDQEAMDVIKSETAAMSEDLSQDDVKKVMSLIDQMAQAEAVLERSYEDEIAIHDRAYNSIMDAAEEYVESAASQTIADIEFAKSMAGQD